MQNVIDRAVKAIRNTCQQPLRIGLILGSGLGEYAECLQEKQYIPYETIEGFPTPSVAGHAGRFVVGTRFQKGVIAMQGRMHFYEGYSQAMLGMGVRVMRQLGVEYLLLTNAAGAVNREFSAGTLMVIADHINFSGSNPLIGQNLDGFGPRFPDMSNIYDKELRNKLLKRAKEAGIPLQEGIYMMFSGPSYETPAEIRMARSMGADAVGMSTVPEAIVAAHCGCKTVGISLLTNMAAGILEQPLSHQEVTNAAQLATGYFSKAVDLVLSEIFL